MGACCKLQQWEVDVSNRNDAYQNELSSMVHNNLTKLIDLASTLFLGCSGDTYNHLGDNFQQDLSCNANTFDNICFMHDISLVLLSSILLHSKAKQLELNNPYLYQALHLRKGQ